MENLNSVCYVQRISEIREIPGADKIELAVINGWNSIVQKGDHKVDDLVVIATTDAVIPEQTSTHLNIKNYLRGGTRVRTIKLRGVYSECLILPINYIREKYRKEGVDCMELMGIFKYEPPVEIVKLSSGRKVKHQANLNFHVYYKFPNLKNKPGMFTESDTVEITRKIHGTNARYGLLKKNKLSLFDKIKKFFGFADALIDYEFVYGSHNVQKGSSTQGFYDTDVWHTIAIENKIEQKLREYALNKLNTLGNGIIIYGEIFGPGIQKGYDYGLRHIAFNMFDCEINGEYVSPNHAGIIAQLLEIDYVPVLYYGEWSQDVQDKYVFNNFVSRGDIFTKNSYHRTPEGTFKNEQDDITSKKIPHEGIVIKYYTGDRNKVAKVINPDYLIYAEKHNVGDSH